MNKRTLDTDLSTIMPLLIGVWRRFRKESGPPDKLQTREFRSVVEKLLELQHGFEKDKNFLSTDYLSDPEYVGAYLLYYWVVHYQQGLSLIGELPSTPRRVLDLCSGPIPFGFAAMRHGASELIALDKSELALQLGAEVCGRYGYPVTARKWFYKKNGLPKEHKFDLIILGHCLEELFPITLTNWKEQQDQFLRQLLEMLTPNGFLMLVESSFLETNHRVLQIRDKLVSSGVPLQAPCVWKGACPALQTKNSPCYAQRPFEKPPLIKEFQRAAEINLGSVKMSYLIFRNPLAGWPQLPDRKMYRVISPPVDSYQGTKYYLCGTDGKKLLSTNLKEHPPQSRAFEYLKRGELISFDHALEQQNSITIIAETEVRVEAACGKPLPELSDSYE